MYRLTLSAMFSASHRLRYPDGQYEPLHEHDWSVEASFAGIELDEMGLLIDFDEAQPALESVTGPLNGANLNEAPLLAGVNPSAEHVARAIFEALAKAVSRPELLEQLRVTEAPGCTAAYCRDVPASASSSRPPVDDKKG